MLSADCFELLEPIVDFAMENDCIDALLVNLLCLDRYGDGLSRCTLHPDHAPLSLGFAHHWLDGRFWLAGGLIYSGPGQVRGGCEPCLSVSLEEHDPKLHQWSRCT